MNTNFSLQWILSLLLGAFLLSESLVAIWKISHQHGPLHISKYFFTALVGLWMCVNALISDPDWLQIAEAAALSAFVAEGLLRRFDHITHVTEEPVAARFSPTEI